jgi:superfamily II DNA or RNA helicase
MSTIVDYKDGSIVNYRDRRWIVLPSDNPDLLVLRPLGGSEDETTAVFIPLMKLPGEKVTEGDFPKLDVKDLGDFSTGKMLFNAARLSFRHASGPFRCMGRLSFRPRNYQVVPLVMALKQEVTRLMVADDVGIGKTVEALLIVRELLERGEIKRFAVLCPPHLCDQWQQELRDKLDLDAVVIRSGTVLSLQKKVPAGQRLFHYYPFQVISIDFIKSDRNRHLFLEEAPELVVVDEAHTCTRPAGSANKGQQMRYRLLRDLVDRKPTQHLLLLTATPHSGKDEEFLSLLGLLDPKLEKIELQSAKKDQQDHIAQHFIQRKRDDIRSSMGENTPFPERKQEESTYELSADYMSFYADVVKYARGISSKDGGGHQERMRWWAALSLLRGCVSSPANALTMLGNRYNRKAEDAEGTSQPEEGVSMLSGMETDSDAAETDIISLAGLDDAELKALSRLAMKVKDLHGVEKDYKMRELVKVVNQLVKDGYFPIVFCRYIATAKYVAEQLAKHLPKNVEVKDVTSELADEQRRKVVDELGDKPRRVLVATDCLSEGINLQEDFTSVVHYDLPWNPNRLEQREGRVDRFGQKAETIKTWLIRGKDNPVDIFVLDVLIAKVKRIQRNIGVSINIGENNATVLDAAVKRLILDPNAIKVKQLHIDFEESAPELVAADHAMTQELEAMKKRASKLREVFAHSNVDNDLIEKDLKAVDEAIGDVESVEAFVIQAITHLGGTVEKEMEDHKAHVGNLPRHICDLLSNKETVRISFRSPTPHGYVYLGRNHRFVEQLCQYILKLSFEAADGHRRVARTSVVVTNAVQVRTTIVQFRVRNVIKEVNSQQRMISEEMYLWGYEGSGADARTLSYADAKELLLNAKAVANQTKEQQQDRLTRELKVFDDRTGVLHKLAEERAQELVQAHSRFRQLVGGRRYEAVHPVLPPDIMGVYILVPPTTPIR